MKCPVCGNMARVKGCLSSDGFAQNLLECDDCGTQWSPKEQAEMAAVAANFNRLKRSQ